jgi:hypothetical protein
VEGSGAGRAFGFFKDREDLRVGVVGLGAGTLAAYGKHASQRFRFYEINPEVTRLARMYFTFLKDCPAGVEVVPGDARLSLEREPPGRFHILVLDAFTGESSPRTSTAEAIPSPPAPGPWPGDHQVHISNRFRLSPVVRVAHPAGLRRSK